MASNKDLNRLKVILAEKKKSNLWLLTRKNDTNRSIK
ncbi:unknown [Prevotella sp. CAG:474]|nr:unknown [Prevotella sp. CAG:474]